MHFIITANVRLEHSQGGIIQIDSITRAAFEQNNNHILVHVVNPFGTY